METWPERVDINFVVWTMRYPPNPLSRGTSLSIQVTLVTSPREYSLGIFHYRGTRVIKTQEIIEWRNSSLSAEHVALYSDLIQA